jgi:hypothetical protein
MQVDLNMFIKTALESNLGLIVLGGCNLKQWKQNIFELIFENLLPQLNQTAVQKDKL